MCEEDVWHPEIITVNGESYTRTDIARELYSSIPSLERTYTVAELSERTGWPKSTINAAIRRGELIAIAPNGGERYRRIRESDWDFFQEKMRTASSQSALG